MQSNTNKAKCFFLLLFIFSVHNVFGQINITPSQTAAILAQKVAGQGITILNPTLTCPTLGNGKFTVISSNIGLDSGIILSTGHAANASGPESFLASSNNGATGDPQLSALVSNASTYDACELQFDFVPKGDTIKFKYVFASEEYINSVCAQYNDVFAFFISGPGISGSQNMALVPGTNVPVAVNSINNGVPGSYSNGTLSVCNAMGPGSPFTQYYVDNQGGTTITYRGFTTPLTAIHDVTPCDTYHLKMAIGDVTNGLYDSGVFIAAGSLKSNTFQFDTTAIGNTINGVANSIVKGCSPAVITIHSANPSANPLTIKYLIAGTAVNGTDYTQIPDSVIMPANDTVVSFNIQGIPTVPNGVKTVTLYLQSPYTCVGTVDTLTFNIIDAPYADILTPDTAICLGNAVQIVTVSSAGLVYNWAPGATLNNSSISDPIATPVATTTYTFTATLPNSGCAPLSNEITISVNTLNVSVLTPDTTICAGQSVTLRLNGDDLYTYNWSPSGSLNNATVKDPIATPPAGSTTYSVTVTAVGTACPQANLTVTIQADTVNASIVTLDTTICKGEGFTIKVSGDNNYTYSWSPSAGLDNVNAKMPFANPATATEYKLTITSPIGCTASDSVNIGVIDFSVNAGDDQAVCRNNPVQLSAAGSPANMTYTYAWSGPENYTSLIQDPKLENVLPGNAGVYVVTAQYEKCFARDSLTVSITTIPAPDVTSPIDLCLNKPTQQLTANGQNLVWYSPGDYMANIIAPVPNTSEAGYFHYYVTQEINNCISERSEIDVQIAACCEGNIFVPTAFTPNGDGLNDALHVKMSPGNQLLQFNIYNRWGQLVYESNNNNAKWDGTLNGQPCDAGTYYYSLIVTCSGYDSKENMYKGNIILIR